MVEMSFPLVEQKRESWGQKTMGKRNGRGRDDGVFEVLLVVLW